MYHHGVSGEVRRKEKHAVLPSLQEEVSEADSEMGPSLLSSRGEEQRLKQFTKPPRHHKKDPC